MFCISELLCVVVFVLGVVIMHYHCRSNQRALLMSYYSPSASQCIMGTWASQGLYFPITLLQGLTCPPAAETPYSDVYTHTHTHTHQSIFYMRSHATPNQTETNVLYYMILYCNIYIYINCFPLLRHFTFNIHFLNDFLDFNILLNILHHLWQGYENAQSQLLIHRDFMMAFGCFYFILFPK